MMAPPAVPPSNSAAGIGASPPRASLLECDYDVNPSFLYQAIEARQWNHAKKVFSKPDAETQAATWVTRKEKDGKLRWRLLPIHAAVIFQSPLEFIETLLQEYPAGAQQKDDQGMLPLHLAFRNDAAWDILEELLTAYPQAVSVKDRKGRTPIQCASSKTAKRASVMELYTQVMVASERQRAVTDSRTVVEARVSSLQDTHANTLANLKKEWDQKETVLQKELEESQHQLEVTALRLEETASLLIQKSLTEEELTQKLELVTQALQTVNEARAVEELQKQEIPLQEKFYKEANEELLVLVQTLLEQQTSLKVQLDKQVWNAQETFEKKEKLLRELTELEREESDGLIRESETWRTKLGDTNAEISEKLKVVLKVMDDKPDSPRSSPRAGM